MSEPQNPNPGENAPEPAGPDDSDSILGDAGEKSLEQLIAEADMLANELGTEVGASDSKPTPPPDGPLDPVAQVERVQEKLGEAAGEIGADSGAAESTGTTCTPAGRSGDSSLNKIDPSEWETGDADIPSLDDGGDSLASPDPKTQRAQSRTPGDSATDEIQSGESVHDVTTGAAGKVVSRWSRIRSTLRSRSDWLLDRLAACVDRPAGFVLAGLAAADKPFQAVPLQVKNVLGLLGIATLIMALVTFAIGWFR